MEIDQSKYRIRPPQSSKFSIRPKDDGFALFFYDTPTSMFKTPLVLPDLGAVDNRLNELGLYRHTNNMVYVKDTP